MQVLKVNGEPILNLRHLKHVLDNAEGQWVTFDMEVRAGAQGSSMLG